MAENSQNLELQTLDVRHHEAFLAKHETRLDKWCSGGAGTVRAEALKQYAVHELRTDERLAACTPTSVFMSLLACAVTGLVPGKLRGYAFLVGYNNTYGEGKNQIKRMEATFMAGWRGVKLQGFRAGLDMVSAVIHEHDTFDWDKGSNPFVKYREALRGRGPIVGTAAWCKLPRGGLELEFLDLETLDAIQKAAERRQESHAWRGPFRDQMQRKSALRRLGKQIEMGEDFFKSEWIETSHDDTGSMIPALDQLTDGDATRIVGEQSTEAAIFEGVPRPSQVQVPANVTEGKRDSATQPARGKKAGDRPTPPTNSNAVSSSPANSSSPAPSGSGSTPAASGSGQASGPGNTTSSTGSPTPAVGAPSGSQAAPAATSPTKTASGSPVPTNPTPATSNGGSPPPPASAATPAASSPSSSGTAPSGSPPSGPTSAGASSADGQASSQNQNQNQDDDFGDVAGEPSPDEQFDDSFGGEDNDLAAAPRTRHEFVEAFKRWADAHPTRESIVGDAEKGIPADDTWIPLFEGWANCCTSKAELEEHKPVFSGWSKAFLSSGRRADPARNIEAVAADPQTIRMRNTFNSRAEVLP